jgi:hypothetical protein
MNNHPVVPPPEILKKWEDDWFGERENVDVLLVQAVQYGADQELEACCEWMRGVPDFYTGSEIDLRAARRPKPPSLAEQGLKLLEPPSGPVMLSTPEYRLTEFQAQIIRAALNHLAELEDNQQ